jgi:hypothetical protein
VTFEVDQSSVRAIEHHSEQLWDATVALMAKAATQGVGAPVLPPWSQLTPAQRDAWIYSGSLNRVVGTLCSLAMTVAEP